MKNFKKLMYVLSLLVFSCSSSSSDDLNPQPDPDPNPTVKVTYNDDIASIISNNCTQCHGNPPTQNAPFSLTTFSSVQSKVNTILSRINNASNPMPPTGLMSQSLRDQIQQWKDDGLLEN